MCFAVIFLNYQFLSDIIGFLPSSTGRTGGNKSFKWPRSEGGISEVMSVSVYTLLGEVYVCERGF